MHRPDRSARIQARARFWAPLLVVAAVPLSIALAGGSTPTQGDAALAAAPIPSDTSTTTGIGRSLCRVIGTQACKDTPSTTAAGTDTGTDTGGDTATTTMATSMPSTPETGLCGNVKLPGACRTTSGSSTVTVEPPGTVTETVSRTKTKRAASTHSTKTRTRSQSATTVTVTVTQSSSASSTTTTRTGTTTTGSTTP